MPLTPTSRHQKMNDRLAREILAPDLLGLPDVVDTEENVESLKLNEDESFTFVIRLRTSHANDRCMFPSYVSNNAVYTPTSWR